MSSQPLTLTLHYEEATLRRAVATLMGCRVLRPRRTWRAMLLLMLSSVAVGWGAGPSIGLGLAGTILGLAGLLVLVIWRAHLHNTVGLYRSLKELRLV